MSCYNPIDAYLYDNPRTGKIEVKFKSSFKECGFLFQACKFIQLPCGQCVGCKLDRSRVWAVRCMHEASLHTANCFVTLTYSDEFLPKDNQLNKKALQLWQKRLRKALLDEKIRFFCCGEYGEKNGRPHYHALVFGWTPQDKEFLFSSNGMSLYRSALLESIWPFGLVSVGDVSIESAAYVARYNFKKIATDDNHVVKPFLLMSRRPGIGKGYLDKYGKEIAVHGKCFHQGQFYKIPRFYADKLAQNYNDILRLAKERNLKYFNASEDAAYDGVRLAQKEQFKVLQAQRLLRE